jgi:hypothetical protein
LLSKRSIQGRTRWYHLVLFIMSTTQF